MDNEEIKNRIKLIREKLKFAERKRELASLEKEMADPAFWQNQRGAAEKTKNLAVLQRDIQEIEKLEKLMAEGKNEDLLKILTALELRTFLSGKYDSYPAIFSIHAGQGGTEAMDWAAMLKRMYLKYLEKKGWDYQLVDETAGEEAGIKSCTMKINHPYAYGYLRREAGTHRLVRLSPFNANNLRQTSFALVEVLPQMPPAEIEIKDDDLEWQFYRSSSQGGQNVQKVSTAVRLLHKPSGIIVTAQSQRFQEQNRQIALEILKAKLWSRQQLAAKEEEDKLKGGRTKAAWGTQIRSYVLHPYKMVKDLRTNYEVGTAEAVLDGDLDGFIEAELKTMV